MDSQNSLFHHDKEELLHALERFDGAIAAEDVTDSIKHDHSRYIHTSFIEVLLECICAGIVKDDAQREILLTELCRQLSQSNFMNEELLLHTLPLRKELSKRFFDYVKKICGEVIPDAEFDFSSISFLEENSTSFRNIYKTYFEEVEEIGRGGFGVVCKARNKMTDTFFAIKKIFFNYKNDSRLCRVIREAKNISVLNHPNVVQYNNAWTEAPSPEDDFNYSSSDTDSESNSTCDKFRCKVSFHSEDMSNVNENELFFHEKTTYSRSIKSKHKHFSAWRKNERVSYNKDSGSIMFRDLPNNSGKNITWSFGSDNKNYSNTSHLNHENHSKNSDTPNSNTDDSRHSYISHSNSETDSDKSDGSVNLNVRAILFIQMEYCDCDLRHWLDERAKGNPLLFEMDVTDIFMHILNGVIHIHSKGIIHRDLKPQNIFYSKSSNTLKIGDFGLATLACCPEDVADYSLASLHSSNIGTLPYAAPEQIKGQSYDAKVDIYSLGVILIELLNNYSTVMELTETIKEVRKGNVPSKMKGMPKLVNLVKSLVKECPEDRMSAKEILSYLQDSKVTLEEREMALLEKEILLNDKEIQLSLKEAALNEKEEEILRLKKAALNDREEILKLKTLVSELQKAHLKQ